MHGATDKKKFRRRRLQTRPTIRKIRLHRPIVAVRRYRSMSYDCNVCMQIAFCSHNSFHMRIHDADHFHSHFVIKLKNEKKKMTNEI